MWLPYNANPAGNNDDDCTVRAICTATGEDWLRVYLWLCLLGAMMFRMPISNRVWGEYLRRKGWKRRYLRDDCPVCYTVKDFCREFPQGVYIVGVEGHVLVTIDGRYLDTWDSGERIVNYYWIKEDNK